MIIISSKTARKFGKVFFQEKYAILFRYIFCNKTIYTKRFEVLK